MKLARIATVFSILFATLLTAATPALAGDCDGTPASDPLITCAADPNPVDAIVGLGLGDDTYVQNAGVETEDVYGDALENGIDSTGNGGDDSITINGDVTSGTVTVGQVIGDGVTGNGGDDTIIVNGNVDHSVWGDDAGGDGGDDTIVINGDVNGNVLGDNALGNGGDDVITINGTVTGVFGDDSVGVSGGNDYIEVNGDVSGFLEGNGGNDTVNLGDGAIVGAVMDGGAGTDTLSFDAISQSDLDALGLDPAGGSVTINGETYTWVNFEQLLGLLAELIEQGVIRLRVFYETETLRAVETSGGINIFANDQRIAFVSFDSLAALSVGESASYNTANSAGWYVTVTNLGSAPDNPGHSLFQVSIYSPGGLAGQFTFAN
jgi:hypothetical protein